MGGNTLNTMPPEEANLLWAELFKDSSQFWFGRKHSMRNPKSAEFRHKETGKILCIDGLHTPPWVKHELKKIKLLYLSKKENVVVDNVRSRDRIRLLNSIKTSGRDKDLCKARRIHAYILEKELFVKDVYIATSLITTYAKCGALEKAREVFEQIPKPDIVTWNALIFGYAQNGLGNEVLNCLKQMHDLGGICPDRVTYISILKGCGVSWSLEMGEYMDVEVRKRGLLQKDIEIGNTLVGMYSKCGALEKARQVFEELPIKDVVSWNALITGYVHYGFGEDALKCFKHMKDVGIFPNSVTYICILKACGATKSLEFGKDIENEVRKLGLLKKDVVLGTALVDMYSKCGVLDEARDVFDQLLVRNIVSWNSLIAGYAQHGFGDEALQCFRQMQDEGIYPDAVTYASVLQACSIVGCLEIGEDIYVKIRKKGLLHKDIVLGTILVDMYSKCGALEKATEVFEQLQLRDVVVWNALISGYVDRGLGNEALMFFQQMQDEGIRPDEVTYICILKACAIVGSLEIGDNIGSEVRKQRLLEKDVVLGTSLVDMYAKCGALEKAREVFEEIPNLNVVSLNALITGYVQHGLADEALKCFRQMQDKGVSPNAVTYVCVLKACGILGSLNIGEDIDVEVRKQGLLHTDVVVGNSLVDMYLKCGMIKKAQEVFEQLPIPDIVSWNALISGYAQHGLGDEAFQRFRQMKDEGICPNSATYISVLKACSTLGPLEIGQDIDTEVRSQRLLEKDIVLGNTLVQMYSKYGASDKAREVFDQLPVRDSGSWNALIGGYTQLGQANVVLNLYRMMRMTKGIVPNFATFVLLLTVCSHTGLLDEGEILFNEMSDVYCLTPTLIHYSCMINLFGRAGHFDKVKALLDTAVLYNEHLPLYMTILGACRKWTNVRLGRWAFEESIRLDDKCASAYVCMESIYLAAEMQGEGTVQ